MLSVSASALKRNVIAEKINVSLINVEMLGNMKYLVPELVHTSVPGIIAGKRVGQLQKTSRPCSD